MFGLQLKITKKLDLKTPLRTYLFLTYSQNSTLGPGDIEIEVSKHDVSLNALQQMRDKLLLINVANTGALQALQEYYLQLESVSKKFPLSSSGMHNAPSINFEWTDTLSRKNNFVGNSSWEYERACCLFNIAVIESGMATVIDRKDLENAKACKDGLLRSASVLSFLRTSIAPNLLGVVPRDLQDPGLSLFFSLLQAQAQVCLYEIGRDKGMNPDTLSIIAGGTSELFSRAENAFPSEGPDADETNRSCPTVPWSYHAKCQRISWDAVKFYRQATLCAERFEKSGFGYGEQIAWLTASDAACNAVFTFKEFVNNQQESALRAIAQADAILAKEKNSSSFLNWMPLTQAPISSTVSVESKPNGVFATVDVSLAKSVKEKVQELLLIARKENNEIYQQRVPLLSELPEIESRILVKITPETGADLTLVKKGIKDLFSNLYSPEVAAIVRVLNEKKLAVLHGRRERATKSMEDENSTLAEHNLPYTVQTGPGSSGVPETLWQKIARCQSQGGINELERLLTLNTAMSNASSEWIRIATAILSEEAEEDEQHRTMYGAKWTIVSSKVAAHELREDVQRYKSLEQTAEQSDLRVRTMMTDHRKDLQRLTLSRSEFDHSFPSGYEETPSVTDSVGNEAEGLRKKILQGLEDLRQLRANRGNLVTEFDVDLELEAKALVSLNHNELTAAIDAVFLKQSASSQRLEETYTRQAILLSHITTDVTRFSQLRSLDERQRNRVRAVQSLNEVVDKYEQIMAHLKDGEGFWTEFKKRTEVLLATVRDFKEARAIEVRETLFRLQPRPLSISSPVAYSPPLYQPLGTPQPSVLQQSNPYYSGQQINLQQQQQQQQQQQFIQQGQQQQHQLNPGSNPQSSLSAIRVPSTIQPTAPASPFSTAVNLLHGQESPSVATLVSMGFERSRVIEALNANHGNFDNALAALLSSPTV
jgi:programmed cell death 6-interacting protein